MTLFLPFTLNGSLLIPMKWRMPDGMPVSVLKGHTGAVTAIAFSPRPGAAFQLLS